MKPVVISGKIGSGKSTVCKLFEDHGYMAINSDAMAKDLIRTNEVIEKSLIESFGADLNNLGTRKILQDMATSDITGDAIKASLTAGQNDVNLTAKGLVPKALSGY